jgi:hypothetical protein
MGCDLQNLARPYASVGTVKGVSCDPEMLELLVIHQSQECGDSAKPR